MDKRFKNLFSSIKTRAEGVGSGSSSSNRMSHIGAPAPSNGTPEGDLLQAIALFVSTGGPDNPAPGEEFLHLPIIVDNAESSPAAAQQAASAIRQNLSSKNSSKPYIHYNSIMLMRILAQNPGYTFTRHLGDAKILAAIKEILRNGRDPSVWQILAETLEHFATEPTRIADEGLNPLRELWAKEKLRRNASSSLHQEPYVVPMPGSHPHHHPTHHHEPQMWTPPPPQQQHQQQRTRLPDAMELAARISEANTSATLLTQLLQTTPKNDIPETALIREFADRCKLASRSMHAYIEADEPAPADPDTLTTLIETNDVLSIALDSHRKAVATVLADRERHLMQPGARVGNVDEVPGLFDRDGRRDESDHEGVDGGRRRRSHSPVSPVSPVAPREGQGQVFRF